jgi:hypothetical protein
MDNKFIKFWKNFGPYILFGTGIIQFLVVDNLAVGSIFMILGLMLMIEKDRE